MFYPFVFDGSWLPYSIILILMCPIYSFYMLDLFRYRHPIPPTPPKFNIHTLKKHGFFEMLTSLSNVAANWGIHGTSTQRKCRWSWKTGGFRRRDGTSRPFKPRVFGWAPQIGGLGKGKWDPLFQGSPKVGEIWNIGICPAKCGFS